MTKRLCVFCGSRPGVDPRYRAMASRTGRAIAAAGWELVYGGAGHGLMGAVADAVLEAGGRVVGIFPGGLGRGEFAHGGLTERHVVASMHERKALMHARSDAFLALPGGFGTMDELFEALTWAQLGYHAKPIGLLDVEGFYRPLLAWVEQAVREGFAPASVAKSMHVDEDPEALVARLVSS